MQQIMFILIYVMILPQTGIYINTIEDNEYAEISNNSAGNQPNKGAKEGHELTDFHTQQEGGVDNPMYMSSGDVERNVQVTNVDNQ